MDLDLHPVLDFARPALADHLAKFLRPRVRLLVVVDTEISLSPGPRAFGIERVIRLLRETPVGLMRFSVDVAQRSAGGFAEVASPPGTTARYTGFRFDSRRADGSLVIAGYDEVWCFGFKPHAAFAFPSDDADITRPSALPASDAELAELTRWMNAGGGLFGTGDHDFLGAPMCHRIPRLGSMRAWTNAQNVPTIGGPERLDTNRPANLAERLGAELIENDVERDRVPQAIEWTPWLSMRHPFLPGRTRRRPHPVLCHPQLGPIDVMPDHPHEGVVFDHVPQPDVGLAAIRLDGRYAFGGVTGDEYPTVNGVRPLPMVIAHGRTLASPPLRHEKGPMAARRFGMVSVYDGHRIGIGRVATDSTWHHWFNMNISGIEAANGEAWQKISRYFLNLAVWLARPGAGRPIVLAHALEAVFSYPGVEELGPRVPVMQAGRLLHDRLVSLYGPCWVTQWAFDRLGEIDVGLRERLIERLLAVPLPGRPFPPRPEPCLSCPDPELFEIAMLGGVLRQTVDVLMGERADLESAVGRLELLGRERFEKLAADGVAAGLKDLQAQWRKSQAATAAVFG